METLTCWHFYEVLYGSWDLCIYVQNDGNITIDKGMALTNVATVIFIHGQNKSQFEIFFEVNNQATMPL